MKAVILADGENINRELIHRGYGVFRGDQGGAEQQAMHGFLGRMFGKYSEEMFFEGDQSALNPARYLPTPYHTKLAQQRTALSQYIQQEAVGTRMRRWDRPIHDFLAPYFRGLIERTTGEHVISKEVEHRRDLETLADMLKYLRAESEAAADPRTGLSRLRPFAALPPVCHHRNPLPFLRPAGPPTPPLACTSPLCRAWLSALLRYGYPCLLLQGFRKVRSAQFFRQIYVCNTEGKLTLQATACFLMVAYIRWRKTRRYGVVGG